MTRSGDRDGAASTELAIPRGFKAVVLGRMIESHPEGISEAELVAELNPLHDPAGSVEEAPEHPVGLPTLLKRAVHDLAWDRVAAPSRRAPRIDACCHPVHRVAGSVMTSRQLGPNVTHARVSALLSQVELVARIERGSNAINDSDLKGATER